MQRLIKGIKVILGFPFYVYKSYKILIRLEKILQERDSQRSSITDNNNYRQAIVDILNDSDKFEHFREQEIIKSTYEHAAPSMEEKTSYFNSFKSNTKIMNVLEQLAQNDWVGLGSKPKIPYKFKNENDFIENISGTSIRYIFIANEIEKYFGPLDHMKIAEIGIGYGGQAKVLDVLNDIAEYHLIDLEEPLKLAERYLSNFEMTMKCFYKTMDKLDGSTEYDLVISNYAFSELSLDIQNEYLEKVILKAKRGFMICNTEAMQQSFDNLGMQTLSIAQLLKLLPQRPVCKNEPILSDRKQSNKLIVFGSPLAKG